MSRLAQKGSLSKPPPHEVGLGIKLQKNLFCWTLNEIFISAQKTHLFQPLSQMGVGVKEACKFWLKLNEMTICAQDSHLFQPPSPLGLGWEVKLQKSFCWVIHQSVRSTQKSNLFQLSIGEEGWKRLFCVDLNISCNS